VNEQSQQVHAELIGQKPVAWRYKFVGEERWQHTGNRENLHALCLIEPLYTSPPARAWGGLTLEDIPNEYFGNKDFLQGATWAWSKHKELNT
jgi:hypothetical protein